MVMPPPAAIRPKVNDPFEALVVASKVSSEVPGGVRVWGENEAVTPEGKFETESVTALVKPSSGVNEMTKDALWPGTRVSVLGSRVKVKFCAEAAPARASTRANTAIMAFIRLSFFISGCELDDYRRSAAQFRPQLKNVGRKNNCTREMRTVTVC